MSEKGRVDPLDEPVRGRLQGAVGREARPPKPHVEDTLEERFYNRLKYVIPILLGVAVLAVLVALAYRAFTKDGEGSGDSVGRLQRLLIPEEFGRAYVEANGGVDFLRSIRTIRVTGTLETPESLQTIFLLKRVPDKSVLRITQRDGTLAYGTDGKEYWRAISRENRIVEVILLEGEERKNLQRSSDFFGDLLGHFLNPTGSIQGMEIDEWEGRTLIRIDWTGAAEKEDTRFFVDPESMDLLRSVQQSPNGRITEVLYSDYRNLGSFRQPFRTETRVNGEVVSAITVESADINPGILSVSFGRPATTAPGRNPYGWSMEENVRSRRSE